MFSCDRASVGLSGQYPFLYLWTAGTGRLLGRAFLRLDGAVEYRWERGGDEMAGMGMGRAESRKKIRDIKYWLIAADQIAKTLLRGAPRDRRSHPKNWHSDPSGLHYPWNSRMTSPKDSEELLNRKAGLAPFFGTGY